MSAETNTNERDGGGCKGGGENKNVVSVIA